MPATRIVLFREADGTVPIYEWLDSLKPKAALKCIERIKRLKELGHELRRPEADFLRDGIHELRASLGHVNYRVLYFFDGSTAAVVTHGIVKEDIVPLREIELAIRRKNQYLADRKRYAEEFA